MNIKRLLKSLGIGAAALMVVTFLYGQVAGPIGKPILLLNLINF